jgi:hypothetical protein
VSEFATEKKHELIGKGILSIRKDGRLGWQGEITNVIYDSSNLGHIIIIQWFDWFMGGPTYSSAIKLSELCGSNDFDYRIFKDYKERNEYYEYKEKYFNKLEDEFIKNSNKEEAA